MQPLYKKASATGPENLLYLFAQESGMAEGEPAPATCQWCCPYQSADEEAGPCLSSSAGGMEGRQTDLISSLIFADMCYSSAIWSKLSTQPETYRGLGPYRGSLPPPVDRL